MNLYEIKLVIETSDELPAAKVVSGAPGIDAMFADVARHFECLGLRRILSCELASHKPDLFVIFDRERGERLDS